MPKRKVSKKSLPVVFSPDVKNKYLRTPDAAHHLGLAAGTLEVYRAQDKEADHEFGGVIGPKFKLLGTAVRYTIEDLDAWAELPGRVARAAAENAGRPPKKNKTRKRAA